MNTGDMLRTGVLLAALGIGSLCTEKAMSETDQRLNCQVEFDALADATKYPDLSARIERWKAVEPQCGGDGEYEYRLGALYTVANRDEEARAALERGLRVNSAYAKEIRLSLFDLDLRQGRMAEAEKGATSLLKEFPQWRGGHRALGQVRLVQERFGESIAELEAANAIEVNSGTYVLLTMAYYKVHRYRECAQAMQRALRMDRETLAHTQAVVAAAYSLIALGHAPEADDLLRKHELVQPSAVQDRYYSAAVAFVRSELAKSDN